MIPNKKLLNIPVTCLPFEEQMMLILRWAKMRASKFICLANVHMIMEAYKNSAFNDVLHQADLVTPDGKPLVWMLRRLGISHQNQVAGMDVFLNLCNLAESTGIPIYFLGSTQDILDRMKDRLTLEYPILKIAGMKSIPFVPVDQIRENHDEELIAEINQSGAGIVFVCLGCPKQEIWMSHYQGRIQGVTIGVGAVFSMYAGITPRAPYWIQNSGLEWLYRLVQEPKRLWKRYSSTIPPFIYLASRQLFIPDGGKFSQIREEDPIVDVATLNFTPEKLGEILVRQNIVTQKELDRALLKQGLHPELKLGEILVRNNSISLSQLKFYLRNQNIKLGQILIERKIIKGNTLEEVLRLQTSSKKKLGQILIEQRIISEEKLREVLIDQYTRFKGLFLTEELNTYDLTAVGIDTNHLISP